MRPVDLTDVRVRANAAAERLPDIPASLSVIRSLLDDYADRAHRVAPEPNNTSKEIILRTPMPVIRAIVTALRGPLLNDPQMAWLLLKDLWESNSREERRIAAEVLGYLAPQKPDETLAYIEMCLTRNPGETSLETLAEQGLGPLVLTNPTPYLEQARKWVLHPLKWARRFGLAVIAPLVKDKKWDNVPGALDVIRNVMSEADPDLRKAAADLVRALSIKSPAEIYRFLREQALRVNSNTQWIVRTAMNKLPADEQAELTRLMRG